MIRTVNGNIPSSEVTAALPHEHIVCFSHSLYQMSGSQYLDRQAVLKSAVRELLRMKNEYGLNLFCDCTSPNIGRDTELLRRVSEESGVHIVCSTGFYYTEEPVLFRSSAETIAGHMIHDAKAVNAGIIKAGVQYPEISEFNEKLLVASALTHKATGLPIVVHTSSANHNGIHALEILLSCDVPKNRIVISHLDGATDEYLLALAERGCYLAIDQLGKGNDEYLDKIAAKIRRLCEKGYERQILLSHDKIFFNGFREEPDVVARPGYEIVFEGILPRLPKEVGGRIVRDNVVEMLDLNAECIMS